MTDSAKLTDVNLYWGWPENSRKAHVFDSRGESLCMNWLFFGPPQVNQTIGTERGPDDCIECFKRARRKLP